MTIESLAESSFKFGISRRGMLRAAALAGVAAPFGAFASGVLAGNELKGPPRKIKLAWMSAGACLAPIAMAHQKGIFEKYNLDVEHIEFAGVTEQLLEAIATGKADAGASMALRWLKPLEQGFDVKLTAGTHGGCMRVVAATDGGIKGLTDLKGKRIGVSDMESPNKNFFSIALLKQGIDPSTEVEWRQYPAELLPLAIDKGEIDALAEGDPRAYTFIKNSGGKLIEISNNLAGEYRERLCCVLGVRGSLLRDDKPVAAALTRAVLEAQHATSLNPRPAAESIATYSPSYNVDNLVEMLSQHTHGHSPVGEALKREIAAYADELKLVQVMKKSTDTAKFAERVYGDVFS
jgi:NitT/TauT family transport system substrate-binding protein